jgi:hypothetical protein
MSKPRYEWEHGDARSPSIRILDRLKGCEHPIATCRSVDIAERIVAALNEHVEKKLPAQRRWIDPS